MSSDINHPGPRITLVIDRYKTMDAVTINFTLPAGVLPPGMRAADVSDRIQAIIAADGFVDGTVVCAHHRASHDGD